MTEQPPYNPLAKQNLARSVADALLDTHALPLAELGPFKGAGLYAIYYFGDFPLYEPISSRNGAQALTTPIYVGKAIPAGARKGVVGLDHDPGQALFSRLNEHRKSVEQSENLSIRDFSCRFLAVEDIWIPLGESLYNRPICPPLESLGGRIRKP